MIEAAENLRIATLILQISTDILMLALLCVGFWFLCLFGNWLDTILPPIRVSARFWEGKPKVVPPCASEHADGDKG